MDSFKKIYSLFNQREKRKMIFIIISIIFSSLLELISVSSLGPFMAIVVNPNFIQRQKYIAFIYNTMNFQNYRHFFVLCGIGVFILVVFSTIFKIMILYIVSHFAASCRYNLGLNLYKLYLYQPYQYFLNTNSSELSKAVLAEIDEVINGVVLPAMNMFVNIVMTLVLFIFIVILNPVMTAIAVIVFGSIYGGIYLILRSKLAHTGKELWEADSMRYKTIFESFGGIKDVKILKKERFFINSYSSCVKRSINARASNQILSTIPAQIMQALAIGFSLAMIASSILIYDSFLTIMPVLAVYAFAIMRIVPNFQGVFYNAAQIRMYKHAVNSLYSDMTNFKLPLDVLCRTDQDHDIVPISFSNVITLKDIEFSYPGSEKKILKKINLTICKNTTTGIAGTTGCGKTTLVDIIMGLLEPSDGTIIADNVEVVTPPSRRDDGKLAQWQKHFGYVPQQIFLSDDTIAANIAFGISANNRDMKAVEHAAKIANLHEFIVTEQAMGYNTKIGEHGVRLSGGQRQRIGIARALYHDPDILVMDEATSALDSITEDAVMDAIHNLAHLKTIIIITHRISTIRECDDIFLIENGEIAAHGTYYELIESNSYFRSMAKVGNEKKQK
jgi:ABC-type bacteriocin/lantibiotic exporter with double-glycine peptidase domain